MDEYISEGATIDIICDLDRIILAVVDSLIGLSVLFSIKEIFEIGVLFVIFDSSFVIKSTVIFSMSEETFCVKCKSDVILSLSKAAIAGDVFSVVTLSF